MTSFFAKIRQPNKTLREMSPESQGNAHYLLFVVVSHKKVFASGSESLFCPRPDQPPSSQTPITTIETIIFTLAK